MKFIQIIALLYLISFTYQYCGGQTSKDECKTSNLDQTTEKDKGKEYCCFEKDANVASKKDGICVALTKYQYEHIKDYIKSERLAGAHDDYSIDCKSFYLEISLLSLFLFLF